MARNPSIDRKHAARIAAVQCLYQGEFLPDISPDGLIVARMGMAAEEDATEEEFEPLPAEPDPKLLRGIVTGATEQKAEIDRRLAEIMQERWMSSRMPMLMRAVLQAAAYELIYQPNVAANIIINEYTTLGSGFFDDAETGFVNKSLQELSAKLR